jgi:hypothetical protein
MLGTRSDRLVLSLIFDFTNGVLSIIECYRIQVHLDTNSSASVHFGRDQWSGDSSYHCFTYGQE